MDDVAPFLCSQDYSWNLLEDEITSNTASEMRDGVRKLDISEVQAHITDIVELGSFWRHT